MKESIISYKQADNLGISFVTVTDGENERGKSDRMRSKRDYRLKNGECMSLSQQSYTPS